MTSIHTLFCFFKIIFLHNVQCVIISHIYSFHSTFNALWSSEYQRLNDQLEYESPKDPAVIPKDRDSAFQHLAVLYIRYIQIFRKIEKSYDELLHPQKRILLRQVVISCLGRLLEIKHVSF